MEDKYYVPEIEELRVGFELEIYEANPQTWATVLIKDKEELFVATYTKPEWRKVKYLSKECIESLGFKCTGVAVDIWFAKEGTFKIGDWTSYKIILHYGLKDHRIFIMADDRGEMQTLFEGECKNKSELKDILKKVGAI